MQVLRQQQMIPSMSRPANPYDNASCESFMKTLKREEIYATAYRDLDHLRSNLAAFIEDKPAAQRSYGRIVDFVSLSHLNEAYMVFWNDPPRLAAIGLDAATFASIAFMPFTYSITNGIGAGFVTYCLIKAVNGKAREVRPLMWVLAVAFIIYFAYDPIEQAFGIA